MELLTIMYILAMGQSFGKEESLKWCRFAYTNHEIMVTLQAFQL